MRLGQAEVEDLLGALVHGALLALLADLVLEVEEIGAVVVVAEVRAVVLVLGLERADPRSFNWRALQVRLAALGVLC